MTDPNDNAATSYTALSSGVLVPESVTVTRYSTTLPSGATAQVMRQGTGKHLVLAERMCPRGTLPGSMTWNMAMIAVKCEVNGRALTLEDVEALPDLDVLALIAHALGKGALVDDISPSSESTAH